VRRYGHASAVIGCCLLLHGGINGEENCVIVDKDGKEPQQFALFDFQARSWLKVRQTA